jgi:hypothetical protein
MFWTRLVLGTFFRHEDYISSVLISDTICLSSSPSCNENLLPTFLRLICISKALLKFVRGLCETGYTTLLLYS